MFQAIAFRNIIIYNVMADYTIYVGTQGDSIITINYSPSPRKMLFDVFFKTFFFYI